MPWMRFDVTTYLEPSIPHLTQSTSMAIANRTHALPARLLSACVVEGARDHLLLCVSSGFLILVKVYESGSTPDVLDAVAIFPNNRPNLTGLGCKVCTDRSGQLVAVGSLADTVLLVELNPVSEKNRKYFKDRVEVSGTSGPLTFQSVRSTVVDYCFNMSYTEEEAGIYLFALFVNSKQRLSLETYLWRSKYPIKTVSKLPLPIMAMPVFLFFNDNASGSVVLVCPDSLYLVKFNDMLSGVTTFPSCELDSFPISYYRSEDGSEVYIMFEDGSIRKVLATNSNISVETVVNLDEDLGSTFILEETDDSYILGYGGNASDGKLLEVTAVNEEQPESYAMETIASFPNWAPASDLEIVGGDIYVASGLNATGAITQLKPGSRASTLYTEESDQYDTIFSVTSSAGLFPVSYVVVSSPIRSKIRQTMYKDSISEDPNPRFWELSENCGFEFNEKTIAAGFSRGRFVQICPQSMNITDLAGARRALDVEALVHASVGNIVATVGGTNRTLKIYEVTDDNDFNLLKETPIDVPVTLLQVTDDHIVVGSHDSVTFYDIEDLTAVSTALPHTPCDMLMTPSSLLIGCRTGHLLYCSLEDGVVKQHFFRKFGDTPIRLTSLEFEEYIMVASDSVFVVNLADNSAPLQIHCPEAGQIIGECPVFVGEASPESTMSVYSCFLTSGQLSLIDVELTHSVVDYKIPVGKTPRRLLYLDHVGILVASLLPSPVFDPDTPNNLVFVDVKTRAVVSPNVFIDRRKPGVTLFSRSEVIYCMAEWILSLGGQCYRYLITGCGYTTSSKGRLAIISYKVKLDESDGTTSVSLGKQAAWTVPEAVYAACQFTKNSLVYAFGCKISIAEFTGPAIEYKNCPEYELPSKVVKLSVDGPEVTVSTMAHGVFVLTLEDNKFVLSCMDSVYRACLGHTAVADNTLISVADKERCVSFLEKSGGIRLLKPVGKVFMSSFISKQQVYPHKPVWRKQPANMFASDTLLCLGMSGELTAMYIMSAEEQAFWSQQINIMKTSRLQSSLSNMDSDDLMEPVDSEPSSSVSFPAPLCPAPYLWSDFNFDSDNAINGTNLSQLYYGENNLAIDILNEM